MEDFTSWAVAFGAWHHPIISLTHKKTMRPDPLVLRQRYEGVLLNTDGRLKGISPMNPLPKDSAFNKSLKQKPKPLPSGVPTFKPWKAAQPARFGHTNRHSLRRWGCGSS
jgi:hypothetical protein